jgi:hypothetical protein
VRGGRHLLYVEAIYYRRSVGQSVLMSGFHLEPMIRFLFPVWKQRISWCGTPSLTRGWVCNLLAQLLLGIARAVTLGLMSRRTHDHILLSHLRLCQPGGTGPRIYIIQVHGGPLILPATGFPFLCPQCIGFKVTVTSRLAASQSVCLGIDPLLVLVTRCLLLPTLCQSQSYEYITTDGKSASLSWCQAPIWN